MRPDLRVHDEMNSTSLSRPCPCNPDKTYSECCKPLHEGVPAATAEALMRSRYSAYVLELVEYLLTSWHASTRPPTLELQRTKWLGLTVKAFSLMGDTARVEFVARYKVQGKAHRLHENSRFVRQQGQWFYVDGDIEG